MTNCKADESAIARLADPEALGQTALEGGLVVVVVSVPVGMFGPAHDQMVHIMEDGAPHLEAWLAEEGRSDHELRLLCGVFCAVEQNLPMDTAHMLTWLEQTGEKKYLDEFATRRFVSMLAKQRQGASLLHVNVEPSRLRELAMEILDQLDANDKSQRNT